VQIESTTSPNTPSQRDPYSLLTSRRFFALPTKKQVPAVLHGIEGRYATALYTAAAKKQALDAVETDLKTVKRVVEKDAKLREFLENPTINRIEKKAGVQQLLAAGKYNDLTKNFFDTLAENGRLYDTVKIINSYGSLMSAYRGEVQVTITSAKVNYFIFIDVYVFVWQ
jgi:F-type H+-transporting ATPase subunit O